jgi:hypothetical protein
VAARGARPQLSGLVPTVTRIAVLLNPTYTAPEAQLKEVEEAARTLGLQTQVLHASTLTSTCPAPEAHSTATLPVHCGNVFDARLFEPFQGTRLSR